MIEFIKFEQQYRIYICQQMTFASFHFSLHH